MTFPRLLVAFALLLVLAPAASAQQGEVIARLDARTPIAAHGGVLAYSVRDAGGGFALVARSGAITSRVPIAPRSVPFDVDLGPDAQGRTVAVYSRCDREPPVGGFGPPAYHTGRGCDLYAYDLAGRAERRLAAASSPTASESWPSIWRDEIAFARTYDSKRSYPYLYVKDLRGGASRRQPGGQREECFRNRRTRRLVCSDDRRSAPAGLELYGRRLAFAWSYQGMAEQHDHELRIDTLRGLDARPRRVATAGGGGLTATTVDWPAFEAGRLYWARSCFGDPGGCPRRYRLERLIVGARNSRPDSARPPETDILAHERAAGTSYVLVDRRGSAECRGDPEVPGGTCELIALRGRIFDR